MSKKRPKNRNAETKIRQSLRTLQIAKKDKNDKKKIKIIFPNL